MARGAYDPFGSGASRTPSPAPTAGPVPPPGFKYRQAPTSYPTPTLSPTIPKPPVSPPESTHSASSSDTLDNSPASSPVEEKASIPTIPEESEMDDAPTAEETMAKLEEEKKQRKAKAEEDQDNSFGMVDALRMLVGGLILSCAMSWFVTQESLLWGWKPWWSRAEGLRVWWNGPLSLTDDQLLAYDGTDPSKPIYLALNGSIYDVTAGRHFYGPGGSYHFFAGRDATRSFLTGCFDTDLTPDVRGLEQMFVPADSAPLPASELDTSRPEHIRKAEAKIRKERELRQARKKVKDGIEGWARVFRGETGKKYWWVGTVKREGGWLERMPERELCEKTQKARPKKRKGEQKKKKVDGNDVQ